MKTIWKFVLEPSIELEMPKGAQILSVHAQGENINLWALVDPKEEKVNRKFVAYGTGHNVPDQPMEFIGTAHPHNGQLVFHVFEVINK